MSGSTITLELTIDEVNLILSALGDQPFKDVYALVGKLQSQASGQMGRAAAAAAPADDSQRSELDPDDVERS